MSQSNADGYTGQAGLTAGTSEFNAIDFIAKRVLSRAATNTLVLVKAVTNNGDTSPVGFVDVQILVNQVDGDGQATPHGIIHHLPYLRLQGGANAVILDPQVGDIGMAAFASHDISSVKATKAVANPGSRRRFSPSDGMYFGGLLNGVPTQIVQFSGSGITITSPTALTITAPTVTINGNIAATGTITSNGHDISSTHRHSQVQSGGANSGPPL